MATDPDIIEIDLAFAKQSRSCDIFLYQRMTEWLTTSNFVTYDNLLEKLELGGDSQVTQIEFPIYLQDAQRVTQLISSLLKKSELNPAEMLLLSCVHHPQLGLPLSQSLKKLITECKIDLEIIELNAQKAAGYIQSATDKELVPALYQLGMDYYYGYCVPKKDIPKAVHYWQLAEKEGFPFASYRLGFVFENDYKNIPQAVIHYLNATKFRHGNSWYALGRLQRNKLIENNVNVPCALECYKAAAKQGNTKALLEIISSEILLLPNSLVANTYYEIYLKQVEINQVLIHSKMQLFISHITYLEEGTLRAEAIPKDVAKYICNGFVIMMLRAAIIGESEQYLKRLRSLSIKNEDEIKRMGQLYSQYTMEFCKVSDKILQQLNLRIKQCKDNNEKNKVREAYFIQIEQQVLSNLKLSEEQKNLLLYAKDLYIFISSLVFVIELDHFAIKHNNKVLCKDELLEIINIIPPNKLIGRNSKVQPLLESNEFSADNISLVIPPLKQVFNFSFNFFELELIDALTQIAFPGDMIIIGSTLHTVYVKRSCDEFHLYDPAHGLIKYSSVEDFVAKLKNNFFTSKNYNDTYLSLNLRIFAQDILPIARPTTKQLLDYILKQRGHNSNINVPAWDGSTALYLAARYNDVEMVRELLARGADCTIANQKGLTPVQIAVIYDHDVILERLAQSKDLNLVNTDNNDLVLLAVQNNSQAVIKVLAKQGINLNKQNANVTPIYLALKQKKLNIVIELLNSIKSIDMLRKTDIEYLLRKRDKLLTAFSEVMNGMKYDEDRLKFIDGVLETEKSKQYALGQFFHTPGNAFTFFFSTKNKTGSVLKIEEYRGNLVAKMKVVHSQNTSKSSP